MTLTLILTAAALTYLTVAVYIAAHVLANNPDPDDTDVHAALAAGLIWPLLAPYLTLTHITIRTANHIRTRRHHRSPRP